MAKKRTSTRKTSARRTPNAQTAPATADGAELIIVAKADAGIRARQGGIEVESLGGGDARALNRLLGDDVRLVPLFGNEDRMLAHTAARAAEGGPGTPDLSVFYRVEAPLGRLATLAAKLIDDDLVEAAYIKPPAEPASINDMAPDSHDAPPATPNFTANQLYLGAAPGGIEATWAHTQPGGRGNGIRVIDIEGAWRFSHEDLKEVQGGVVGGVQSTDIRWRNHGTAVIGVFGGDVNAIGITGISPNSNTRAISIFGTGQGSAKSIRDAADLLSAGDIILIELHRPGPRHNFASRDDQRGYVAIEWWPDDWAAVKYASNKGVIVVEAAGNGAENLDDGIYNVRPTGFPASWTNPYNRANRDSGAIVVGAGAPPPGTHGRNHGPDRSRLDFSNFGALVDAQGWGREVTTAGYGDLQGGTNEDLWYTDTFSGTSSASPIVVGAIACMQGNRKARGLALFTPAQVRQKLRTTGSPQTDAPGRPATQRIGTRPNLRQLIGVAKPIKETIKDVKEIKQEKNETKEVKNEKVEVKEKVEKLEIKEIKERKEFDKQLEKRIEKQREKQFEGGGGGPSMGDDVDARLQALEAAVGQISHFISAELRPDLGHGALSGEEDVSQALDAASMRAKDEKDAKDYEKPGDV